MAIEQVAIICNYIMTIVITNQEIDLNYSKLIIQLYMN